MLNVVTGDDGTPYQVTLTKNDTAFSIQSAAIVSARLITEFKNKPLTDVYVQANTLAGSDWPNGIVAVVFPSIATAELLPGRAQMEIQVNDGGQTTWFVRVLIVTGTIP